MSDVPSRPKGACRTCGAVLPLTTAHFHRDANNATGLKKQCRECACDEAKERYKTNSADVLARLRDRRIERTALWESTGLYEAA
ncbi:hypothetical protein [Streptomyces sp. NBC_01285]|uniref:hypothetical protein n=1 Tax=Streptomyces sp. NBC_01285 TaxID=2903813 RepID=UPI002255C5C4|nr:hypothetical protein [Streptomyces sp. NBC_01285]MCX4774020.1 hypothetical protein [Streptomyces sp. NBC_01285]